jgi:hypothetical protein
MSVTNTNTNSNINTKDSQLLGVTNLLPVGVHIAEHVRDVFIALRVLGEVD